MTIACQNNGFLVAPLLLSSVFLAAVSGAHALTLTGYEPGFAAPGESLRVQIDGLDPSVDYSVAIGKRAATVTAVEPDALVVEIPGDAETGTVEVRPLPDRPAVRSLAPYRIVAPVAVSLAPDVPVDTAKFEAATFFSIGSLASEETNLLALLTGTSRDYKPPKMRMADQTDSSM